jgi:hypothetical protein
MTYTTYVNGILHDFRIPCYYYVCPKCNKNYLIPNCICSKCSEKCERKPYEYSFFNNQLYQKRITANNEIYYVTIVDNFLSKITNDNKNNNNISYKGYITCLHKKCSLHFDNECIIIECNKSMKDEDVNVNENKIEIIENKNVQNKIPLVKKEIKSNDNKLCKKIFNKLKVYDVKFDTKIIDNFLKVHDEYIELHDILINLSKGNIYKNLFGIDELLSQCNLFKVDNESYDGIIEYTNDEDVKLYIELCYMFIHNYVIACSNLPKVKKIIDQYRKTNINIIRNNFLNDDEYDLLFNKLKFVKDVKKFNENVLNEKLSMNKIVDKLKYVKLFSYDVLKVIDE